MNRGTTLLNALRPGGNSVRLPQPIVPTDYKTSKGWAKEWGVSLSHAIAQILLLVDSGEMERKIFHIQQASGRNWPTPHYKLKK